MLSSTNADRFLFLGNHFNYPSKVLSIFTKVVVQQICFTPVFNTYFFGMQAVLTGEPPSGILRRIRQAVPESIVNSLKLWPAVTAFSFTFIMPQYRFMFSGIFAVCWQTYLSYLNRREEKNELVGISKSSARVIQGPAQKP
jgi:protein Mpv17